MKSYRRAAACLLLCLPLAGCGLLEREYRSVEPHSYSYREETGGDALRVSSYQDLVNAVLLLAEERRETGRIHIQAEDASSAWDMMGDARAEVLLETPAGAYALEQLSWDISPLLDDWAVDLILTYRRTAEEEDAIIDASSSNAVYDLIPFALAEERQCLAVRFAHLDQAPEELVRGILALQSPEEEEGGEPQTAAETGPEGSEAPEELPAVLPEEAPEPEEPWQVFLYPNNENAGIVEIFFWTEEETPERP